MLFWIALAAAVYLAILAFGWLLVRAAGRADLRERQHFTSDGKLRQVGAEEDGTGHERKAG